MVLRTIKKYCDTQKKYTGVDETAVGPGRSRVPGEGTTGAKVGDRLPGADLEDSVVAPGFVAEISDACVGSTRGSLGRT
jgi:hypothetical protein